MQIYHCDSFVKFLMTYDNLTIFEDNYLELVCLQLHKTHITLKQSHLSLHATLESSRKCCIHMNWKSTNEIVHYASYSPTSRIQFEWHCRKFQAKETAHDEHVRTLDYILFRGTFGPCILCYLVHCQGRALFSKSLDFFFVASKKEPSTKLGLFTTCD